MGCVDSALYPCGSEPYTILKIVVGITVLCIIYWIMLLHFKCEELKQKDDYRRAEKGEE